MGTQCLPSLVASSSVSLGVDAPEFEHATQPASLDVNWIDTPRQERGKTVCLHARPLVCVTIKRRGLDRYETVP